MFIRSVIGMFGIIKNKITSLFTNIPSSPEKIVLNIFLPLQAINKTIPSRITNYIMNGYDTDIINDLNKLSINDITNLFGTLSFIYHNDEKYHKARDKFYRQWSESYQLEQIIRFGKILATIHQGYKFDMPTNHIPLWFWYLFLDGLVINLRHVKPSSFAEYRPNWSLTHLHEILDAEQPNLGNYLIFAVFERSDENRYFIDYDHIFNIPDISNYIMTQLEWFKQLPDLGLSRFGQMEQLNYIKTNKKLKRHLIDFIVKQSISESITINNLSAAMLTTLPIKPVLSYLQHFLMQGSVTQRGKSAKLLARLSQNEIVLQQALEGEKSKAVQKIIKNELAYFNSVEQVLQQDIELVIPSWEPVIAQPLSLNAKDILYQNYQELLIKFKSAAEFESENNKAHASQDNWHQKKYKQLQTITNKKLDEIYCYLNGDVQLKNSVKNNSIDWRNIFWLNKRLQSLPEFNLFHLLRINKLNHVSSKWYSFVELFKNDDYLLTMDLRQIADILTKVEYNDDPKRFIARLFLSSNYILINDFAADKCWPFFAENLIYIDEAFNLSPSKEKNVYHEFKPNYAIEILTLFPQIPAKYIPYLLELAFGENKKLRQYSQIALANIQNIHQRAEEALLSTKQDIRIIAAKWLGEIGENTSIEALKKALHKEKRETVQAAFLSALKMLNEDISSYLTPEKLLSDAEQGLRNKKPKEIEWFDDTTIPSLTWQNGQLIDAKIIQWWIWLAAKLKETSNPLLVMYLQLLSKDSQSKLAQFILQSFIAQDTQGPSLEEAEMEVNAYAKTHWQSYLDLYNKYPHAYAKYENITLEKVVDELTKAVLKRYVGSAISSKGILVLICSIQGHDAMPILHSYLKDHYTRRFQIEAILDALVNSEDPLIIQWLLSIARRHRTRSIQDKAQCVVEQIAERNHWTADELADRTIATAGLDEMGQLILDYGDRSFIAYLNANLKFILKTDDNKEIKTLPEARKEEDKEVVKEAKKLFSTSKKELKHVLDIQTARLYEAMCIMRRWQVTDWQTYLHDHPLMHQLIQRLIWLEIDNDGLIINSFRPTEDGSLIDANDNEVKLNAQQCIILAHAAVLPTELVTKWQIHLKDYKIKPLFNQLTNVLPEINDSKNDLISHRKGWLTDTYTLRNILTKQDYKRDQIEDGACFNNYFKLFTGINICINIDFSGSYVPEENIPAVLYNLYFTENNKMIELAQVPLIILAEGYADYLLVANACSGFDPQWEKKGLW